MPLRSQLHNLILIYRDFNTRKGRGGKGSGSSFLTRVFQKVASHGARALPHHLWFSKTQPSCRNGRHGVGAAGTGCGMGTWEASPPQCQVRCPQRPGSRVPPAPPATSSRPWESSYSNWGSTAHPRLTPVDLASLPRLPLNMLSASKCNKRQKHWFAKF